jgi:hypothetical protein
MGTQQYQLPCVGLTARPLDVTVVIVGCYASIVCTPPLTYSRVNYHPGIGLDWMIRWSRKTFGTFSLQYSAIFGRSSSRELHT